MHLKMLHNLRITLEVGRNTRLRPACFPPLTPFVLQPLSACFNLQQNGANLWNREFWTFFFLLIEYWNIIYIFTLILSTIKRKMKLSCNVAFPTMLQSVTWLSFSVFGESLKIENWKWESIFNFFFRPKHSKSLTELPKGEGEGSIHTIIFCS